MREYSYETILAMSKEKDIEQIKQAIAQNEVPFSVNGAEVRLAPSDTIAELVKKAGAEEPLKAVHVGAPLGIILPADGLDIPLNAIDGVPASLEVRLLSGDTCMLDYLKQMVEDWRELSCGRCVLCREGIRQLEVILRDMTEGNAESADVELLRDLGLGMADGSYCDVGRGIGKLILSALNSFGGEFDAHARLKRCNALVCSSYVTFHILGNCTGCGECMDVCEEDAIQGKPRFIHVIDQRDCIHCGKCVEACKDKAVVKAGAVKPRTPLRPMPCGSWRD